MDEFTEILNSLESTAPPASETPQEVVLRYDAPGVQSVVERYVAPLPLPGRQAPQRAEALATVADAQRYVFSPREALQQHKPVRRSLWIALAVLAVLALVGAVAGIVQIDRKLRARTQEPADESSHYEWHTNLEDYSDAQTRIPTYPNGEDVRLRFSESHAEALSIQEVYARVNPCTVTVATALSGTGGAIIGTGVIFTSDGYILTNAHVIAGGEQCYVVLDDGTSYDARLVGSDAEKDLAVLKVNAVGLPVAEFGDSDALSVGDTVYAIGNPLGVELRGTLTDGIVSAINRDVSVDGGTMTLIQTNAALNNGNSGGPLINIYGQVVGINTMKMGSSSTVSVEGLGFAIPVSSAAWMVNDLIAYGELRGEPVLGIIVNRQGVELPNGETGLVIYEVSPGGPGDNAQLQPGDCIVRADGEPLETVSDLLRIRRRYGVGEAVTLEIDRSGERFAVIVILGEAQEK